MIDADSSPPHAPSSSLPPASATLPCLSVLFPGNRDGDSDGDDDQRESTRVILRSCVLHSFLSLSGFPRFPHPVAHLPASGSLAASSAGLICFFLASSLSLSSRNRNPLSHPLTRRRRCLP